MLATTWLDLTRLVMKWKIRMERKIKNVEEEEEAAAEEDHDHNDNKNKVLFSVVAPL